jgi:hypothetical protein
MRTPLRAALSFCVLGAGLLLLGCGLGENTVANPGSNRSGLWSTPDSVSVGGPRYMRDRVLHPQISTLTSSYLFLSKSDSAETVAYLRFTSLPDTAGMLGGRIGLRFLGGTGAGQALRAAIVDTSAVDWTVTDNRLAWDNRPATLDQLTTGSVIYPLQADTVSTLVDNLIQIPSWWIGYWVRHPSKNRGLAVWLADPGLFRALSREYVFTDTTGVVNPVLTVYGDGTTIGTVSPTEDAYVYLDSRPLPSGHEPLLTVSEWPPARALFRVDSLLPGLTLNRENTINRATLRLHCHAPCPGFCSGQSIILSAYRVGEEWSEDGAVSVDSVGARYASVTVYADSLDSNPVVSFDLAALFQLWVDGGDPNYGVLIRSNYDAVGLERLQFYTKDAPDSTLWPKVDLVYSKPPVPR